MRKLVIIVTIALVFSLVGCGQPQSFELFEGQDTVEINTEWDDAGAGLDMETYWKDYDTKTGEVDTSVLGTYEITYFITHDGEEYSVTRYVQVVDQTLPVLSLNPGVDTITVGDTWEDTGAVVTDNSEEELTIVVTGEVDSTTVGTYEITYTSTDSSGNTASIIRYVDVIE